jgi:hypothetical protein
MNKTARILILLLAAFFFFIGVKSALHSTNYAELTNIQKSIGTISQLHCPPKGAASLSLVDSNFTYNLSVQFRANYCDAKKPVVLVGKEVSMESVQVNGDFYQVYQLKEKERVLLSPNDVEADQSSATLGLFFLTFLLVALVTYKSRRVSNK